MTTALPRLTLALVLATLALGGWAVARTAAPGGEEDRIRSVAAGLRCPTCVAGTVADSQAPMAVSMRETVRDQVRAGWSDDRIRAWFSERYGPAVLLSPPARGLAVLLWTLPPLVVVLSVGAWHVLSRRRGPVAARTSVRNPSALPDAPRVAADAPARAPYRASTLLALAAAGCAGVAAAGLLVQPHFHDDPAQKAAASPRPPRERAVAALEQAVRTEPTHVPSWLALGRALEEVGRLPEAAAAYRSALDVEPTDPTARYLLSFALLRSGQDRAARAHLRALLETRPDHPEGLLLLGTLRHREGNPAGAALLRRFLREAPDHPAAAAVRRLL